MITAHLIRTSDGSPMIRLTEMQGTKAIFQRTVTPEDAMYLIMEIEEIFRTIRIESR